VAPVGESDNTPCLRFIKDREEKVRRKNKMSENDEKNCEFCGAEMVFLRGEANGLSCPNAFLHEEEKIEEEE
jgi:hypothetical protein